MSHSIDSTVEALLPLLRRFARGTYGIALGGAHAKGTADAQSDLDLYVFAESVLPATERAATLAHQFSPAIQTLTQWGDDTMFVQSGIDFYYHGLKVECWLRRISLIEGILTDCQAGMIRQELVTWTVMGFFNHCTLNDLHQMEILDDPAGFLAGWKAAVKVYPPLLRKNIVMHHMEAAKFWYHNFHYETAVLRGDILYAMGIVQQVIHNLCQVLFALNRVYFGGDKKTVTQLAHLTHKPEQLEEQLIMLTALDRNEPDALANQRDALYRLIDEVEGLLSDEEFSSISSISS